jgi:hypothetical protein
MPFVGIGVGVGRQRFASGIFAAYAARVAADGGTTEAGACVDAVSALLQTASLLLIPSGYKSGKVYSEIPTNGNGDLTFTRASTATRVNSDGEIESVATGVPRLDYSQGSCPALLLEPQRTNLFLRSEEFENASWVKINSTITTNTTTAPDGNVTADTIFETTATDNHGIYQTGVLTNATSYTYSFFVKPNGRNWVSIRFLSLNGVFVASNVWFDIANGTIGTTDSGITATIQASANGFYRVTATRTTSATGVGFVGLYLAQSNNSQSYTGSDTSGIFIWGAQLEAGAYATSYIPTLGTSVTRVQENFSKTGLGLTNSTIFFEFTPTTPIAGLFDINKTVGGRAYYVALNSASFLTFNSVSGGTIGVIGSALTIGANYKIAMALNSATSQLSVFLNGAKLGTYTTDITTLGGFNGMSGFGYVPQYKIQSIAVFPTNLSDSEAIALTTL